MAWVGDGPREQSQYRFTVALPQRMLQRRTPGFVIERLSLEEANQVLQIELTKLKPSAEPGTAPNGGPAAPVGNSEAAEGPPSVS